ncbi:MAG: hypothetical protein HY815_32110, partial [Candidatus Riflebacteria bacterium]|nr:hypothetical protein [Candidatus Riflebacteria bacterium]
RFRLIPPPICTVVYACGEIHGMLGRLVPSYWGGFSALTWDRLASLHPVFFHPWVGVLAFATYVALWPGPAHRVRA